MSKTIKARIEELETAKKPGNKSSISVCWRSDDLVEWTLPNGEIELITEAEFLARGGRLIKWDEGKGDQ